MLYDTAQVCSVKQEKWNQLSDERDVTTLCLGCRLLGCITEPSLGFAHVRPLLVSVMERLCRDYKSQTSQYIHTIWPGSILLIDHLNISILISLKWRISWSKSKRGQVHFTNPAI